MRDSHAELFEPDYNATPAQNVGLYLSGLPRYNDRLKGLDPDLLGMKIYREEDGSLDLNRMYSELISRDDINSEMVELMRYTVMFDLSKNDVGELTDMMVSKHAKESSYHPIARSRNSQQWRQQANNTFGIENAETIKTAQEYHRDHGRAWKGLKPSDS